MDRQREKGKEQERKEREEADWVRDRVEAWDGYLGTAGVQSLGLYRHPPRDPSNLRVPEGRERLEKYCPGLWEKWAVMRDNHEERNGKLYALYEKMISKLESGVISGSDIPMIKRRLIVSFSEDIDRRSRDKPKLVFEIRHDPDELKMRLVASDRNDPIAIGKRKVLDPLLGKITRCQDLPIMGELASYEKECRVSKETDDHEWYLLRTRAVETLETKYGLHKKTNGLVAM